MRTRVLFLLDQLNLAGAQKRAVTLARGLDPERFEVHFVCLQAGGPLEAEIEAAGFDLTILAFDPSIRKARNLVQLVRLYRLLREKNAQIVHSFFYWSTVYGSIAAKLARVPVIVTSRTSEYRLKPKGPLFRAIERATNPLATCVVAISRAVMRDTIEREGVPEEKVALVYNGVELDRVEAGGDSEALRASLGLAPGDTGVVLVANLHPYKRHDTFLRAAARVVEARPRAKFVVVGRPGAASAAVQQLESELGIAGAVCWAGVRKDIPQILSACDVGVLCSESEALGNALLEYMDAGLPAIGTRVGGIPEIIVEGETGALIDVGDDEALARHLIRWIDEPEEARRLGAAGRERVRSTFSRAAMVRGYADLYDSLLAAKGVDR